MKTISLRINWLVPFVGIAVVVGTMVATRTYVELERKADAADAFGGTLDRMFHDQELSMALEQIQRGEVAAAAQRLDRLLCQDVIRADSDLDNADALTRATVQDALRRIALIRPKAVPGAVSGSAQQSTDGQLEAERILTLALGMAAHAAQAK
jgi:hypothetical protein